MVLSSGKSSQSDARLARDSRNFLDPTSIVQYWPEPEAVSGVGRGLAIGFMFVRSRSLPSGPVPLFELFCCICCCDSARLLPSRLDGEPDPSDSRLLTRFPLLARPDSSASSNVSPAFLFVAVGPGVNLCGNSGS